jgi:energy-coupling factor transport system permease protein
LESPGFGCPSSAGKTYPFNIKGNWKKVKKILVFIVIYQLTFVKNIVYLLLKTRENHQLKEPSREMALKDITLGQYAPRDSWIHQLDPRTKVFIFLGAMLCAIAIKKTAVLGLFGLFGLALYPLALLNATIALKNVRPFLWLFLLTFLLHALFTEGRVLFRLPVVLTAVTAEGAANGIYYSLRIAVLLVFANAMTLTASPMELTDALERFLGIFRRIRVPAHEIALMVSLAIRFVPLFIEETDRIRKAQVSRGCRDDGPFWVRIRGVFPVIVPLFLSSFRKAGDLAFAMDARCYRGGEGRTSLRELRFHGPDGIAAGAAALAAFAFLWLDFRLHFHLSGLAR